MSPDGFIAGAIIAGRNSQRVNERVREARRRRRSPGSGRIDLELVERRASGPTTTLHFRVRR
jgi:hypothetical protein